MDKTAARSNVIDRRLRAAAVTIAIAAILSRLAAQAAILQEPPVPLRPRSKELNDALNDCFITDLNGRKWPCTHINNPAANRTLYECPIENRLGVDMRLYCNNDQEGEFFVLGPGQTAENQIYPSVYDPAPPAFAWEWDRDHTSPNVTCQWRCAGNTMNGVVVWNEQWPEHCKILFETNREVVLVTRAGRRVLGDLAIKECSKNLWGYGGWLPFGRACTYPKHDHDYYGTIG